MQKHNCAQSKKYISANQKKLDSVFTDIVKVES